MEVKCDVDCGEPPGWFREALDAPGDKGSLRVRGSRISFRAWGHPDAPGVVLVHGTAAHARWWGHIAPHLACGRRVVAFDLSGHGDSEWRPAYSQECWAAELLAVVREIMQPRPLVIAHSLGGKVAFASAAAGMDQLVSAIVFLDSNFGSPLAPDRVAAVQARSRKARRTLADRDSVIDAFRPAGLLLPLPRYLREYISLNSAERVPGGWAWKFDPGIFDAAAQAPPELARLKCPTRILRAERGSLLDTASVERISVALGPATAFRTLPESGHHMMLDAPLQLVSELRRYLARW